MSMMKTKPATRLLSLLLAALLCFTLLPVPALAKDADSVVQTTFSVYEFTGPVSETLPDNPVTTIDLSRDIFAWSSNGCSMSGLCMWRVDSPDSAEIPTASLLNSVYYSERDGDRYGDRLYTLFSGSMNSGAVTGYSSSGGSSYEYYYGYGQGGIFPTHIDGGFPLIYRSGGGYQTQYIQPGYYRFVMYYGSTLYYSAEVFTVTDTQNVAGNQGVFDVEYYLNDSPVTSATKGSGGVSIVMRNFRLGGWTSDAVTALTESDIQSIDLISVGDSANYDEFTQDYRRWSAGWSDASYGSLSVSDGTLTLSDVILPDSFSDYRVKVTTADGKTYVCDSGLHALPVTHETAILTGLLSGAVINTPYSLTLSGTAADGGALTWSVTGGSLPAGMALSPSGVLSGTPTEGGDFTFTVTATAADSSAASRAFTLSVTRPAVNGFWSGSLTPQDLYYGAQTNYTVNVRPSAPATPTADSTVEVTLPDGVLQQGSRVTDISPAGVSGSIEGKTVTLTFDGSTRITASNGVTFTLTDAVNPSGSLSARVSSPKWTSASVEYSMSGASIYVTLVDTGGVSVTIANWDEIKDMDLRLAVEANGGKTDRIPAGALTTFNGLGIQAGDSYTVTLSALDALFVPHTYATFTGTGNGMANQVALTADPAAEHTLTCYRPVRTLGGSADVTDRVSTTLYKGNTPLYCLGAYYDGVYAGSYWLTAADADADDLSVVTHTDFAKNVELSAYDRDGTVVTPDKNAGTITVDYPLLDRSAAVSGAVKDEGGAPIPYASVMCSQTVNGAAVTVNVVADKSGAFTIPSLYAGKSAALTVWANGYLERGAVVTPPAAGLEIVLPAANRITAVIGDGQSVANPRFTVYGNGGVVKSYSFSSGTSFALSLPQGTDIADGAAYTVVMTSDDTAGQASAAAVFQDGTALAVLKPARLGVLDWSGLGGAGYSVLIDDGTGSTLRCAADALSCSLPAGTYKVYLSTSYKTEDSPAGSNGSFTVAAGETTAVSGITPPAVARDVVGGLAGPRTAAYGELYKLTGSLETEIYGDGSEDFWSLMLQLSDNTSLHGAVINGTYVTLPSGAGYTIEIMKSSYPEVDWTFPLSFTLYVRQRAAEGESQSVRVQARYGYQSAPTFGSVETRSVRAMSLYVPARVGAQIVSTTVNGAQKDFWQPEAFAFSGMASPGADVRLYDNDELIAVAKADGKGSYSGSAYLASTISAHFLRAEQEANGEILTASGELTYDPAGPVLTALTLTTKGYANYSLPLNGAPAAYSATPSASYVYRATIRNDARLADISLPNPAAVNNGDRETVTAKVFFRVFYAGGEFLLPATRQDGVWRSEVKYFGANYPTGVEVIYSAAPGNTEATVPLADGSGSVTVDHAYVLYNSDGTANPVETTSQDALYALMGLERGETVEADFDLGYPDWDGNDHNGWYPAADVTSSVTDGFDPEQVARLSENSKSVSDLIQNIANSVNEGLAGDLSDESGHVTTVSAINGSQATAVGAGGLTMETRTWVDQPTWTREGVKWRVEELRAKGYQVSSATYDDWQYLYFTATFYYDKYGKPSSLTRTVHAMGGVDQTEPNPEMFRRTTGEMIGSSLKVEYIYSIKEGKWMRCQTAMIPPGATSPIHLAANQIPNGTEPPYRYTDAGELSADILEDSPFTPEEEAVFRLMATSAANRKGGMNWGVKLDKVQDSTYNGMALSATGYLGSKWVGAAKKLHKVTLGDERQIVDVGKLKFVQGSYSVSAEESIVTGVSWMAGQVPQGQATKFGDIGGIREQLLANYKYYSDLEKNPSYAYRASLGKKETKQLLEELGDLESAIGMAGVQDAFTQNVTAQLSGASGIIGLFGGPIGAEASFAIDLYSTFLKAANDTNNADVQEAVQRFLGRVDGYKASDSERKRDMKSSEQEKKDYNNEIGFPIHSVDENVFNDPFSDSYKPPVTAETTPVHDPSGVIYEGVIENPVADATVTLWRYDESESTQSLVRHDDSAYLGQANPLASDGSGHYSWDVPEGLWYVTAEKDGYAAGSSRNDVAATENRSVNDEPMRFLPVLPPQLDVNIPLVDASAPKVADVRYTTGGIYVTFSKYMTDTDGGADSVLNPASYSLCSVSPEAAIAIERVTPVERGHAPANVDSAETTYTRTVLLETREPVPAGTALTLTVSGAVTSYAGTAMGENHTENGTAAAQEQTAEPVLSVASGTVARNSAVEITCADRDAVIYYTTDGKEPTAGSKRYDGPIPINGSMTVKAIAVSVGRADSSVSSASFAVTAEALDPGSLSAAVTAGGVTVRFTPPEGSTYAKGFCAVFGEFGQLLGVAPLTVSAAEQTLTVTCDSAKASSVRVFFLDGNSAPVYDYMSAPVSR